MKDTTRPFRIGKKGNWFLWLVAGVGFIASLVAFIFSFFPPGQIAMGSKAVWFTVLILGCVIFTVLPFIILACKKASWLTPGNAFVPFHWDKSPEAQAALAKAAEDFKEEEEEEAEAIQEAHPAILKASQNVSTTPDQSVKTIVQPDTTTPEAVQTTQENKPSQPEDSKS